MLGRGRATSLQTSCGSLLILSRLSSYAALPPRPLRSFRAKQQPPRSSPPHPPSWHVPSCDTTCFLVYLSCVYSPTRIQEPRARVLCGSPLYPQCLACGRTWHLQNVWMSPSWINVQSLGFSLFLLTGPLMIWADSEGVPDPMALGAGGMRGRCRCVRARDLVLAAASLLISLPGGWLAAAPASLPSVH